MFLTQTQNWQKFSVPFRGPPRYNPRRRSGLGWGNILSRIGGPPSPCPSDQPFSSASSEGSSSQRSHEDDVSIVTGTYQSTRNFCLFCFFSSFLTSCSFITFCMLFVWWWKKKKKNVIICVGLKLIHIKT